MAVPGYAQGGVWEQTVEGCRLWGLLLLSYSSIVSQPKHDPAREVTDHRTDKALKGYTNMKEALEPAGEEDVKRYKEWMETSRPLVKAEGMVLIGHPDDLACLQRRADIKNSSDVAKDSVQESRQNTNHSHTEVFFIP